MLAGKTPAETAKAVEVARQAAYTWKAQLDEGGIDALSAMAIGWPARLGGGQLEGFPFRDSLRAPERATMRTWQMVWGSLLLNALAVKYPHAPRTWGWQWVSPRSGVRRRHHLNEATVQKAMAIAARCRRRRRFLSAGRASRWT
jgi:hypothetical protein